MEYSYAIIPIESKPTNGFHLAQDGEHVIRVSQVTNKSLVPSMLRNRTTLAYLHQRDLLVCQPMTALWNIWAPASMSMEDKWTWFDRFFDDDVINVASHVGAILVLSDQTAPFSAQSPVMLLRTAFTPKNMAHAFDASLRWLGDHPGVKQNLDALWAPKTQLESS